MGAPFDYHQMTEAELEFVTDLDDLVQDHVAKGVCGDFIVLTFRSRCVEYSTARIRALTDIAMKVCVMFWCGMVPIAIQAVRFHAAYTGHQLPTDNTLTYVSNFSMLAVVSVFFDFKQASQLLEKIIRLWRSKK